MSATLGDVTELAADLTRRNGRETAVVDDAERPVPLTFTWALTPLAETLEEIVTTHQAPVVRRALHAEGRRRARHLAAHRRRGCRKGTRRRPAGRASGSAPGSARRSPSCCAGGSASTTRGCCRATAAWSSSSRSPALLTGHLRHRHPRRRHQRADPHGAVHRAREVRRQPARACCGSREFLPDRRPGRPRRLRHRRLRRRPGARAHHRQREGQGEGRGQERRDERGEARQEGQQGAAEEAARGHGGVDRGRPSTSSSPGCPSRWCRG